MQSTANSYSVSDLAMSTPCSASRTFCWVCRGVVGLQQPSALYGESPGATGVPHRSIHCVVVGMFVGKVLTARVSVVVSSAGSLHHPHMANYCYRLPACRQHCVVAVKCWSWQLGSARVTPSLNHLHHHLSDWPPPLAAAALPQGETVWRCWCLIPYEGTSRWSGAWGTSRQARGSCLVLATWPGGGSHAVCWHTMPLQSGRELGGALVRNGPRGWLGIEPYWWLPCVPKLGPDGGSDAKHCGHYVGQVHERRRVLGWRWLCGHTLKGRMGTLLVRYTHEVVLGQ